MAFRPEFNTAPGTLVNPPGGDYASMLQQGFGGIAGQLQKNRDFALGLADTRAKNELAQQGLTDARDYRTQALALTKSGQGVDMRGQDVEAAKAGLKFDPSGKLISDPDSKLGAGFSGLGSKPFDDITKMRTEIKEMPSYKKVQVVVPTYKSMTEASRYNDKASDLAIVYGLAQILDPASSVKEGEQVTISGSQGWTDILNAQLKNISGGANLSEETRTRFLNIARQRAKELMGQYDNDLQPYRNLAKKYGFDEADIMPGLIEGDFSGEQPPVTFKEPTEPGDPIPGAVPKAEPF